MEREKIDSLIIIARKWTENTYGNTYHTVTVFVNGHKFKSDLTYGYGKQYIMTAADMLRKAGYDIPADGFDAYNFIVTIAECDEVRVARKKDL